MGVSCSKQASETEARETGRNVEMCGEARSPSGVLSERGAWRAPPIPCKGDLGGPGRGPVWMRCGSRDAGFAARLPVRGVELVPLATAAGSARGGPSRAARGAGFGVLRAHHVCGAGEVGRAHGRERRPRVRGFCL